MLKQSILAIVNSPEDINQQADKIVEEIRRNLPEYKELLIILLCPFRFDDCTVIKNTQVKIAVNLNHFKPKKRCSYIFYGNGTEETNLKVLERFKEHKQMPTTTYEVKGGVASEIAA